MMSKFSLWAKFMKLRIFLMFFIIIPLVVFVSVFSYPFYYSYDIDSYFLGWEVFTSVTTEFYQLLKIFASLLLVIIYPLFLFFYLIYSFFALRKAFIYSKFPSIEEANHYFKVLKRVKRLELDQQKKIQSENAKRNYQQKMKELEERKKKVL